MNFEIKYNYHDSYIDDIEVKDNGVLFFVVLYSVYYPESPRIKIELTGIFNHQKVAKYFQLILAEAEGGEIGCRVEVMHLDSKKESVEDSIYIFLKTSWDMGIQIHCSRVTESICQPNS